PLDALARKMLKKMPLNKNDRDLCVMQHEVVAEYEGDRKEKIISTLLEFGIPNGDSSMARTVSLPAAIGARMILDKEIKERGVLIPVLPSIYEPMLRELETGAKIAFSEKTITL
ncbi:MAG: saccharopine dehydrogenase C-terminal domain-containing protein, partial [Planctomycetota bacterium]